MFPLVKIPCILIATVGLHVSTTPPAPPPTEGERVASTTLEALLGLPLAPLVLKGGFWSVAFAEIAVILANYAPTSSISRSILSNLIFVGGNADSIHASPLFFAGIFAVTFGGWLRYKCYQALGSMFTFQMSIRKNHALVTSGPYSVVRHPAYTGSAMKFFGLLLLHGAKGSWLRESGALETKSLKRFVVAYVGLYATVIFGLLQRMVKEDETLHRRYGKEWEDWARRVPSRLIPWLF